MGTIKGLTLHRPWPWSILYGGKRVENRPWAAPRSIIGQFIALHAGKTWDDGGAAFIKRLAPAMPGSSADHPLGIVGVAKVTGCRPHEGDDPDPWAFGPYVWTLSDVVALPNPVPCLGAQGLWPIRADVLTRVREGYKEALGRLPLAASNGCICPAGGDDPVRCYALRTQGFYTGKGVGPMAEHGQPDECGCGCHDAWEAEEDDA